MSDRAQKAIARVLAIARLSQETEQTEGVDGFDDAIADLVAEIECDNIFSTFRGEKSETESAEDVVVRVFHTEEIKLCGNTVFAGDVKCGTLSWLVHWDPPAIAANCTVILAATALLQFILTSKNLFNGLAKQFLIKMVRHMAVLCQKAHTTKGDYRFDFVLFFFQLTELIFGDQSQPICDMIRNQFVWIIWK